MGVSYGFALLQEPTGEVKKKIEAYEACINAGLPVHPDVENWVESLEYVTEGEEAYPSTVEGFISVRVCYIDDGAVVKVKDLVDQGITHISAYASC